MTRRQELPQILDSSNSQPRCSVRPIKGSFAGTTFDGGTASDNLSTARLMADYIQRMMPL